MLITANMILPVFLTPWFSFRPRALPTELTEQNQRSLLKCCAFLPGILRYRVDFQSMEMDGEYGNDFYDSDDEEY